MVQQENPQMSNEQIELENIKDMIALLQFKLVDKRGHT